MVLDIDKASLQASIEDQLKTFKTIANNLQVKINHIKPHGALYNKCAADEETSKRVIEAIINVFGVIPIYASFSSVISKLADVYNIPIIYEAFADRNYNDDLSLVSRSQENALIHDPEKALLHVLNMVGGKLFSVSGKEHQIEAKTFCVHGDNPAALKLVQVLVKTLNKKGFIMA